MMIKVKWFKYLLFLSIIWGYSACMASNNRKIATKKHLNFNIEVTKEAFYPGEPVLVSLKINNTGKKDKVYLGNYEEFCLIIIRNQAGDVVSKGVIPYCLNVTRTVVTVRENQTAKESIVLNQWCSTLLPSGKYCITFLLNSRLNSERKNNKPGPVHKIELSFDIQIIKMNVQKFKQILSDLAKHAFPSKERIDMSYSERHKMYSCQEMLAVTESVLALPLQFKLVKFSGAGNTVYNTLNAIVRSNTREAAEGMVRMFIESVEDKKEIISVHCRSTRNMKDLFLNAIYKLRDKGNPEVIKVTENIVKKYKRPLIGMSID